jgi:hypothetical protein
MCLPDREHAAARHGHAFDGPCAAGAVSDSPGSPPSANASNSEPAELIAVFVADEGAQLTTFVE